jgi:hypothetical protein
MPVVTNLYSFSFNSQTFGGAGSPYQILSVDGLEGIPAIRNQDDNRGYADGMFTGADFYGGRTITMIVQTFASGGNSAQTNFNTLQSKLLPQSTGTTPLYFLLSPTGTEQYINARVRGFRTTIDPNYTFGYITSQIEFFCPYPVYFDNVLQTASLSVSNPLGRTYNRVYNLVYGGGSVATTTSVNNAGWATAYPTITLNGPITNPTLGNSTQGNYLSFSGTYTNTDSLVINLQDKLITLNGVSARNLLTSGVWFSAPPGTSQFYLTGTSTVVGTTAATIQWYNAYI